MFVIFGWGRQTRKEFGPTIPITCPNCRNRAYMHLSRLRTWFTLFFIPVIPYESKHLLLCEVCSQGIELQRGEVEKALQLNQATTAFLGETLHEEAYRSALVTNSINSTVSAHVCLPGASTPPPSLESHYAQAVTGDSFDQLRQAAENGDAEAQVQLGHIYDTGNGIPQDYGEAVRWYRKAAEQGHATGQNNLGAMYMDGTGVPQDGGEALKWLLQSADKGVVLAYLNLGFMYKLGKGIEKDFAEAYKWFMQAAELGYAKAQNEIGFMYQRGEGLAQDYGQALQWYRKAAEQGYSIAQWNVGCMYENGLGVDQDFSEAAKWYRKAARLGDVEAQNKLKAMGLGWMDD